MRHLPHLTDDQIDDSLIGDLTPECAAHLAACDDCQVRLSAAEAPIASFNAVSLAWSERRSATMPVRPPQSARAAWLPRAGWAATAAAVLAVGISVPISRHAAEEKAAVANREVANGTLMASTGPVDNPVAARDEQIDRDNQMLQSINSELNVPADSPDREYGLHPGSQTSGAHVPAESLHN